MKRPNRLGVDISPLAFALLVGSIFYCPACESFKSCEDGAADDYPDFCDDCANLAFVMNEPAHKIGHHEKRFK